MPKHSFASPQLYSPIVQLIERRAHGWFVQRLYGGIGNFLLQILFVDGALYEEGIEYCRFHEDVAARIGEFHESRQRRAVTYGIVPSLDVDEICGHGGIEFDADYFGTIELGLCRVGACGTFTNRQIII
jgi:hypothetical protein